MRLLLSSLTGFLILPGEEKKKKEKKSEAKSGVIISTCGAKSLKESPMFGDLSLGRDQVSGRNKKTFSTFVSGMKESHLSLATVENSCDTVDQTRLPESAGGLHMAKYLQFLQQLGLCLTLAVAQLLQFVMIWYSETMVTFKSKSIRGDRVGGSRSSWPTQKIAFHSFSMKSSVFSLFLLPESLNVWDSFDRSSSSSFLCYFTALFYHE